MRKEIGHILSFCSKMDQQCSFSVDSDHFPVLATLKLKLKRAVLAAEQVLHLKPVISFKY